MDVLQTGHKCIFACYTYSGDLKSIQSKSGLFEGLISNGQALVIAIAIVPTIQKPDHPKSGCFWWDFKWFFLQNGGHLFWISNGWASHSKFTAPPLFNSLKTDLSGFQIPTVLNVNCVWCGTSQISLCGSKSFKENKKTPGLKTFLHVLVGLGPSAETKAP